jgi:hypothetical protein
VKPANGAHPVLKPVCHLAAAITIAVTIAVTCMAASTGTNPFLAVLRYCCIPTVVL